jgi:AcrR family transcriptional regulator
VESRRTPIAQANAERILAAAAKLLAEEGRDAVSTRAVSAAAGVQAPTIYRIFGDKQGLLDAVASEGFKRYIDSQMSRELSPDPVEDLRAGWKMHVGFGLANPELFSLIYGEPRRGPSPPAAVAATEAIATTVRRIAQAGRLRIDEHHAAQMIFAAGSGTTLTLIGLPEDQRDLTLSDMIREALISAITSDAPVVEQPGPIGAAVALRAVLPEAPALSTGERALLSEWLERIAHAPAA